MARLRSKPYMLLDGRRVSLNGLDAHERRFLADLQKMVRQGVSYFEIYRSAAGPGSVALGGRNHVDRQLAQSPLYLAAMDLATRAGIKQGLILAPEFEAERQKAPRDGSMISVLQAATLIGISRAAVYKAIEKGTLRALRIGNVTIVDRKAATDYREQRLVAPQQDEVRRARRKGRVRAA